MVIWGGIPSGMDSVFRAIVIGTKDRVALSFVRRSLPNKGDKLEELKRNVRTGYFQGNTAEGCKTAKAKLSI